MSEIRVETKYSESIIDQATTSPMGDIVQRVIRLQDEGVRDALVKLGWTPPGPERDALLADRDRLAARLEISDDPEMSPDKIDHLEGMLEAERRYAKRLAAELARVRSAGEALCASLDPVRETLATLPIFAARARLRAALAQPQDGTTEGKV